MIQGSHPCEASLREDWNRNVLRIVIEGKDVETLADEAQRIVNEEWSREPAPARPLSPPRRLEITAPGPPAKPPHRRLDIARGLLEAEFANGVRVWLKPLPGLGGSVSVFVHAGHGALAVPREQPALRSAAELLLNWNPLPEWNATEFEAALPADDVSVNFEVEDAAFRWRGETSRAQLLRQLEVLCACVHSPGLASLRDRWTPSGRDLAWNAARAAQHDSAREYRRAISGDDPRLDPVPSGFNRTDSIQTAAWLLPNLKSCRLGVMIAGDFAPDEALTALAGTFGALPSREAWDAPPPYPALPDPEPRLVQSAVKTTTASAALLLPLQNVKDVDESLHALLLAELVRLRMRDRFRRELSVSYSPSVQLWSSPDNARDWLLCQVKCDVARLNQTARELRMLLDDIQMRGWTADEWQRAARPLGPSLRGHLRDPHFWIHVPTQPESIPPPAELTAQALLRREGALKLLAVETLQTARAAEVRLVPKED